MSYRQVASGTTTIPVSDGVNITGTISVASGAVKIVGVGTTFTTDLLVGGWIVSDGNVLHVRSIQTDLIAYAYKPPVAAIAAKTAQKLVGAIPVHVIVDNTGAGAATINGQTLPAGKQVEFLDNHDALAVDSTSSTVGIVEEE